MLAELSYGDTALIRRMNVGLRRRKDKARYGATCSTPSTAGGPAPPTSLTADGTPVLEGPDERIQRVVPYVEDHRNALLINLAPHIPHRAAHGRHVRAQTRRSRPSSSWRATNSPSNRCPGAPATTPGRCC